MAATIYIYIYIRRYGFLSYSLTIHIYIYIYIYIVKDNQRKPYLLIDMSVPMDNNVSVKEYDEEILRHENWNFEKNVVL